MKVNNLDSRDAVMATVAGMLAGLMFIALAPTLPLVAIVGTGACTVLVALAWVTAARNGRLP